MGRSILQSSESSRLAVFLLPFSQPNVRTAAILVDELDTGDRPEGTREAIGFVLQNKREPTFFAFFRLVHRLPADLSCALAVSAGGKQAELSIDVDLRESGSAARTGLWARFVLSYAPLSFLLLPLS